MRLFRKNAPNTQRAEEKEQPWLEKMAVPFACLGIKAQKAFAEYMDWWTGKLSLKRLKAVWVIFCLSSGGFSGYLIISSIAAPSGPSSSLKIQSLQVPKTIGQDREDSSLRKGLSYGRVLRRSHASRRYIDSLRTEAPCLYDRMATDRPNRLNGPHRAEKMYDAQALK